MRGDHRFLIGVLAAVALTVTLTLIAAGRQPSLAADYIIYIDADATGDNNGSSWEDAFTTLQPALEAAVSEDEIWVAEGTYQPTVEHGGTGDRYKSFQLKNGVALYGGFDPSVGDTDWEDRDWASNPTVLSGDIGEAGEAADNSFHVFYHPSGTNLDSTAILNGFTIRDGNANHNSELLSKLGGGMLNQGSSPVLSNCTFAGNSASFGGGLHNRNSSSPTLSNCTFSGNSAGQFGGGMANYDKSSPVLSNCTFAGNSALAGGGMVNSETSSPVMSNCTFTGNSAGTNGGGMSNVFYSSPTLTNCTFAGNSANYSGGMFNNYYSSPVLINCTFSGNSATFTGGGMSNVTYSSPTLTGCTFTDNSAGWGGGMSNGDSSSPTLTGCTFSGNSATFYGGGLRNSSYSSPALTNCTFAGNSATFYGGGMSNTSQSSPMLSNCTFSNNSAESGGGVYNAINSPPVLTNCTFSGNSATLNGGGMFNDASSPVLTNAILWGDTPGEIYNVSSSPVVTYSDIQGGYAGEGNMDSDPLFADAGNGDFHLKPGSPCIDAGNNAASGLPEDDFEDDDRLLDGDGDGTATVDMGVDEYLFVPAETNTTITSDDPDPSQAGETFTVIFTVTSTEGVPNGEVTVTVIDSPASCSTALVDGLGSCELTLTTPGDYTLTAAYESAPGFLPSTDSEPHSVVATLYWQYLPLMWKNY